MHIITERELTIAIDFLSHSHSGNVLVQMGGIRGSVCAKGFSDTEANVTCRQLGYQGGVIYNHKVEPVRDIITNNTNKILLIETPFSKMCDSILI